MTATIMLIRHAAHSHLGRILSGRSPDIALSTEGRSQASALAARLRMVPLTAIHSSPVQRAQETAQALQSEHSGVPFLIADELDELDFGDWSGRAFVELASDPRWESWNQSRSTTAAPNGESMAQAQERAWSHIERTARANPGATIAMVTHCDVIRAVIAGVLGLSLDYYGRFDVDPASCTRLAVGDWGAKVLSLNETCHEQ
ncbi:histidine phosphatase family protein [Novosphingobium sp. M1R2S20]|uniref:Histidine phosphatase family protein n=1 Tax=Novosphingobium rhizovicinum TaxID=3228928 RepID=A0ABV3RCG9_9SPHN